MSITVQVVEERIVVEARGTDIDVRVEETPITVEVSNAPGPAGPTGATGAAGPAGADGLGVPAGGLAGAVLMKASAADNDTEWTLILDSGLL